MSPALALRVGGVRRSLLILVIVGLVSALSLQGSQWLLCQPGVLDEASPDGAFRVDVCRSPIPFAFPGQGSDAPGFAVLRDAGGRIAGIVRLKMVGAIEGPVRWSDDHASLNLSSEFALPERSRSPAVRVAADVVWRLQALLGLVPEDSEFR